MLLETCRNLFKNGHRFWNSPNFGSIYTGEKKVALLAEEKRTHYKTSHESSKIVVDEHALHVATIQFWKHAY